MLFITRVDILDLLVSIRNTVHTLLGNLRVISTIEDLVKFLYLCG